MTASLAVWYDVAGVVIVIDWCSRSHMPYYELRIFVLINGTVWLFVERGESTPSLAH